MTLKEMLTEAPARRLTDDEVDNVVEHLKYYGTASIILNKLINDFEGFHLSRGTDALVKPLKSYLIALKGTGNTSQEKD